MASSSSRAASVEELKARGNDRFSKGDLAGAAKLYKLALRQGGAPHLLQSNLSAIYLQGRMLVAALGAAEAAIAADPSWPKGHFRRGSVLAALELWREAELSYQRALALEPQNATLHKALQTAQGHLASPHALGAGSVFSWGRGEFGALGHGDTKDRALPRMVDALRGRRLLDLSCGTGHTLAVLDDGDVYAWGWNAKLQCGVPTPDGGGDSVSRPTLVGGLLGCGVHGVACGAAHSVAVTRRGRCLSWGLGGSGQLGLGEGSGGGWCSGVPREVAGLNAEVVQGVACGYGHTVVLTRGGALFAWGWNRDGQLGVNDTENRHAPVRLGGLPPMLHVACGGGTLTLTLTTDPDPHPHFNPSPNPRSNPRTL